MENQKVENPGSQCWKTKLEENFQIWISKLEEEPNRIEPEMETSPDLFSFYAELSALRSEIHRRAKRDHDAYTNIKETLSQFDETLRTLAREQLKQASASYSLQTQEARMRSFLRSVIDLYERFKRIEEKLQTPPAKRPFFSASKWRSSWNSLKEGFAILEEHFQKLLNHEGIRRINCKGKPFDPNSMQAVDFELIDTVEPNTVLEELSGGYYYQKNVLKYAEVKVAVAKGDF